MILILTLLTLPVHAATLPGDIQNLEKHVRTCNKLAANPPTEEKLVLALEAKMKKQGCEEIDAEEKKLRWKYRNQLKLLDAIEKITEEKLEDEESPQS